MSAAREKKKEEARMAFMVDDIERMLGSEPCTLEELSEALNSTRDASQHIAQGEIAYALEVLSDSKRVVCIEADGVRRWRVVTDPVRRRLVMEALCALALDDDPLYIYPAARVVERIVERCQQYDREQVVAELRQLVGRYLAAGYVLLPDTVDAVLSLGVPAWARMSLGAEPEPAEAPKPAEPVEGAHLAQVHEDQAAMLRAAKAKKKGGKSWSKAVDGHVWRAYVWPGGVRLERIKCRISPKTVLFTDLPYHRRGRRGVDVFDTAEEALQAAVITYDSEEPSPETGHVGWCWWALGKMGDAPTREAACAAAEAEITRAILRALRW